MGTQKARHCGSYVRSFVGEAGPQAGNYAVPNGPEPTPRQVRPLVTRRALPVVIFDAGNVEGSKTTLDEPPGPAGSTPRSTLWNAARLLMFERSHSLASLQ
jgi:hypothetical protein